MKVLLQTDADAFAGTEAHIHTLALTMAAEGVDVMVACPPDSPLEARCRASQMPVLRVPRGKAMASNAVRQLAGEIRRSNALIHAHNGRSAFLGALAVSLARRGRFIYTQHFMAPAHTTRGPLTGQLSRWIHRWINSRSAGVIAISEAVREKILGRQDVPASKIRMVHNGIADPAAGLGLEVFGGNRENSSPFTILSVSRLEREKNLEILIDAMGFVKQAVPEVTCLIAGEGSQRQALSRRVQDAGLEKSITFLGQRPDVPSLIGKTDVFVQPARSEAFGLAIVEAMALERAVIAMDSGGPREIVRHGKTGLLVQPGDAIKLASAIVSLARNGADRQAMGRAGRARFLQHFTADRMARETLSFYREILGA